ncbi:APC family permease [Cryptosporangium minutisporangium]|uniref:APC family permease n=1 Tax=Cryptosporangium minutisporangium TaxID=113569 RepID=A0ABP6T025_9ACTN
MLMLGAIPTGYQFSGSQGVPLVMAIAGLCLCAFAVGNTGIAGRIRHRGGHYALVSQALGPIPGLGVATLSLAGYVGLVAAFLVVLAGGLTGQLSDAIGLDAPISLLVVVLVVVLIALEFVPLRVFTRCVVVVVILQAAVVLAFGALAVLHPADDTAAAAALDPAGLLTGSFSLALCVAVTNFVGSEIGPNFSEEVATPSRTVPRATLAGYALTTATLVISAWATSVVVGPDKIVAAAQGQLEGSTGGSGEPFTVTVARQAVGGDHLDAVVNALTRVLILGGLASAVIFCQVVARQLSGLSRDRVMTARLQPRLDGGAPLSAGLIAPLAAGAVALLAAAGRPSQVVLYLLVGGGLAITAVLTISSLATVVWLLRTDEGEAGFFGWEGRLVAAMFAFLTTGFVVVVGTVRLPAQLPAGQTYGWLIPVGIAGGFLIGLVWAGMVRISRPEALAGLGRQVRAD